MMNRLRFEWFAICILFSITLFPYLPSTIAQEERRTLVENDFNSARATQGWRSFSSKTVPNVVVKDGSLRGMRSNSSGLTALSVDFEKAQSRISIEFSLAFSSTNGRAFHIWSHEPNGKDASQLNLCIQNGTLQQFDGRTRQWKVISRDVKPSEKWESPRWHRIRLVVDFKKEGVSVFVGETGKGISLSKAIPAAAYRTNRSIQGLSFVSGSRIAKNAWYRVDDLVVKSGAGIEAPLPAPSLPKPFQLWTGPELPRDPSKIPFVKGVTHETIHRPSQSEPKFLHGAALTVYGDVMYAHWANSPTNENGPHETLRGKVSNDKGKTWSSLHTIAPGFDGAERHSHGVFLEHDGELWTFCSRFGVGTKGRRFPGLKAEAFQFDGKTNKWISRGIAMENCWPYDQPVKMNNGDFITGGQDKDGLPVVAVSEGNNLLRWTTVAIPYPPELAPSFAETSVVVEKDVVTAVIRGGGGAAWVSESFDEGKTWTRAKASNFPMPRAKAYLGRLSNGQPYLVSNYGNRDTLCISVGESGAVKFNRIFRIRHGKSEAPRYPGNAKGKQWSYPYAFEYEDKLYVVYSVGKEECGMSIIPLSSIIRAN